MGAAQLEMRDGAVSYAGKTYGYAELARSPELAAANKGALPAGTAVTGVKDWKVLGTPHVRVDGRDIVTGAHRYPRDIVRPGMLYGRVLRAPSYGATLVSVDLSAAQKMPGVTAVRDGGFVACAAPTSFAARKALEAISATAQWKTAEPSVERHALRVPEAARAGAGPPAGARRGAPSSRAWRRRSAG